MYVVKPLDLGQQSINLHDSCSTVMGTNSRDSAGFEILRMVDLKIQVLWDVSCCPILSTIPILSSLSFRVPQNLHFLNVIIVTGCPY
jgi:hypothetical protein